MKYLTEKNKLLLKRVGDILYKGVLAFLVIIAAVLLLSNFNLAGNIKLFTVQSGSMEPAIDKGAMIIVKPMTEYRVGDIINISEPANPDISVTHRITDIETTDNQIVYITKGDANESADSEKRLAENVRGKVIFSAPLLGYVISFTRTKEGLLLLIILPSILIIIREIIIIIKEIQSILKKRTKKKNTKSKTKVVKVLLIICTASIVGVSGTQAYLVDTETSIENTISAGVWEIQNRKAQIFNPINIEASLPPADKSETTLVPTEIPMPSESPSPTPRVESKEEIILPVTITPSPTVDLNLDIADNLEE